MLSATNVAGYCFHNNIIRQYWTRDTLGNLVVYLPRILQSLNQALVFLLQSCSINLLSLFDLSGKISEILAGPLQACGIQANTQGFNAHIVNIVRLIEDHNAGFLHCTRDNFIDARALGVPDGNVRSTEHGHLGDFGVQHVLIIENHNGSCLKQALGHEVGAPLVLLLRSKRSQILHSVYTVGECTTSANPSRKILVPRVVFASFSAVHVGVGPDKRSCQLTALLVNTLTVGLSAHLRVYAHVPSGTQPHRQNVPSDGLSLCKALGHTSPR
mmetsp:Transcript_25103/g.64129  ORF Transcript_25103/g.64129 Transcript_25103/m.64129 type:complete len:271 (+) Transcript_25103:1423-2235(+)